MDYQDFTSDDTIMVKQETATLVGFSMPRFAVLENVQIAKLPVIRTGNLKRTVSVDYVTIDGTAKAGEDYITKTGTLEFSPNETEKTVEIEIMDDNSHEEDEEFYVQLSNLNATDNGDGPKGTCEFRNKKATVVIIDDDDPGVLRFASEQLEVQESVENSKVILTVHRVNGCVGKVGCKYTTEDGSAIRGADYKFASGTLEFDNEVMSQEIEIEIISRGRFEHNEEFRVVLTDVFGGKFDESTDGGKDSCICTIIVKPNSETKDGTSRMLKALTANWEKSQLGHANYAAQFQDALFISQDEDAEGPPGVVDYILHGITMPWKIIFALVPPVDYMDGWLCFFCSLLMIGGVTYIVGQLASFLGCCIGIADEITAITFVALGTSLPDTFASKTAAVMDEYADASIGNVTGSNSVNVFLGLGLPWMIGAMYWVAVGPNAEWVGKYPVEAAEYPEGIFVVQAHGPSIQDEREFIDAMRVCIGTIAQLQRARVYGFGMCVHALPLPPPPCYWWRAGRTHRQQVRFVGVPLHALAGLHRALELASGHQSEVCRLI
jgi:solute carrier family 8 (sodium/calcium exchanger)